MKDVDFNKALKALPDYCLALMQNVSQEDQQELGRSLSDLESAMRSRASGRYSWGLS
jgi:hypothetical protein